MTAITTRAAPAHKAIEQLSSGLTVGHALLAQQGSKVATAKQAVHDGDTVSVRTFGNFGVRFLGVDAAEISCQLPGHRGFTSLRDPAWEAFLIDPFASNLPPFAPALAPGLVTYLRGKVGPGAAKSQYEHAVSSERELEEQVATDITAMGSAPEDYQFFLAFAHEVIDRYGRLLCYLNRDEPDPVKRPLSYNERMLEQGQVLPYFIWPNINPFRSQESLAAAVPAPGTAHDVAGRESTLRQAQEWMRRARLQGIGVYDAANPLRVEPFEVRYLARRTAPERWVIDLSKNDDRLIPPQDYYTVPEPENRLFIPPEYVPLFVERGWHKG